MRRSAVVGGVVAAAVVALTVGKVVEARTVTGDPPRARVTYAACAPEAPAPAALPARVRRDADRAARLVAENDHDFLGSYVEDRRRVVIEVSSVYGRTLARRGFGADPGVVVEEASVSLADVRDLGAQLRARTASLSRKADSWAPCPRYGGMTVRLTTGPTAQDRAEIAAFAEEHGVPIVVSVSRGEEGG